MWFLLCQSTGSTTTAPHAVSSTWVPAPTSHSCPIVHTWTVQETIGSVGNLKCEIVLKLEGDLRGVDGRGGVDGGVAAAGVALLLQTEETTREGFHKMNKR